MSMTWNPRLVKTPTPTMSATTIAVAVNHATPVDGPPDAELGMTDSPPHRSITRCNRRKFNRLFQLFLRRLGATTRPRKNARQRSAPAGGRKPRWPEGLPVILCFGPRFLLKLSGKPSDDCRRTCSDPSDQRQDDDDDQD